MYLTSGFNYSNTHNKPTGVLLVGPPGCGKTLLAKSVAGEAGVPFFQASGSDFDEMFVGTGSKRVRSLFQAARAKAPCVIFIDEIDSVGSTRTNSAVHPHANQTINQLLAEFDRLTDRFLELLNRKRIEMNDDEMSGVAGDKRPSSPSVSRRNSSHNDDRVDKAFLSFFVNKVIIFYDKLSGLKADLIAASKKSTASGFSGQSTFGFAGGRKRTQSSASNSRQSGDRLQRRNSSISNDTMLQFRLRKVESLQLKINRLTKGKEFKHFFGFINNQSNKGIFSFGLCVGICTQVH